MFPSPGELSGNHIQEGVGWVEGLFPKTLLLLLLFYYYYFLPVVNVISGRDTALCSRASPRPKQCFCDFCSRRRASSCHVLNLPVLFMHFSACLECFIRLHNVIRSVCTSVSRWLFTLCLFYTNHTNDTKEAHCNE